MPNTDLVSCLRTLLTTYEHGVLSSEEAGWLFEHFIRRIEGIDPQAIEQARELSRRLFLADLWNGLDEVSDPEDEPRVLADMRRFLDSLPGGADA